MGNLGNAYNEAYTEIYYILKNMDIEYVSKIPTEIIDLIKENRAKNYNVTIDANIPLEIQKIKPETKAILSVLYNKFWS